MRSILAGMLVCAALAFGQVAVHSGALSLVVGERGTYTLNIVGQLPVRGAPLSVFVNGGAQTISNGGLKCSNTKATSGKDKFGSYAGAELSCTASAAVPVIFSWHAYTAPAGSNEGKLVATVALPEGGNGTAAQGKFDIHQQRPKQFAPFPAWHIEGALNTSAFLCYGGDKSHLYSAHATSAGGNGISDKGRFFTLHFE
jgi:hypothetical protein